MCAFTGEVVGTAAVTLPVHTEGENAAQKATAAVTYGRRTCTASLFGIAEKDDDGNSLQKDPPKRESSASSSSGKKDLW
jgi:hypothetical protein